jgi:NO-binding membrane sensor protein with MHYT domain
MMEFRNNIVFLSYAISFLGAYLTISLCEQVRLLYLRDGSMGNQKYQWFLLMGISLGGVGIWCMHFIGMSAMILHDDEGNKVPVFYNIPITIASLIVAILTTAMGIYLLSFDRLFAKSQHELFEMFVDDLKHLPLNKVRQSKTMALLQLITLKSVGYLVIGGIVTGSGVCIMHYVGMSAVAFDGQLEWDAGIVAASVLIAVFAATAAFWILFRLLSIYPGKEHLRITCALIMGIAVCGMHYTGMVAATFVVDNDHSHSYKFSDNPMYVSDEDIEIPVLLTAMFVLWVLIIVVLADLRKQVHKYQAFMKKTAPNGLLQSTTSPENSLNDSSMHVRFKGLNYVATNRQVVPCSTKSSITYHGSVYDENSVNIHGSSNQGHHNMYIQPPQVQLPPPQQLPTSPQYQRQLTMEKVCEEVEP